MGSRNETGCFIAMSEIYAKKNLRERKAFIEDKAYYASNIILIILDGGLNSDCT